MAIFHNRKLFPFLPSTEKDSSSPSSPPSSSPSPLSSAPCYEFCDPSCPSFDDCFYFPDPPDSPPPPPPPLPPAVDQVYQLSPIIIVVVVVLAAIFLLVSCCAFILKCVTSWTHFLTRRGNPNSTPAAGQHESDNLFGGTEGDQDPVVDHPIWYISTVGLQQSVINSITVVRYKRGDGLIEGADCSVCLGEFQEGETLRLLPKCNHAFHIDCIDPWLRSHTNCPLCRAGIVVNSEPSRAGLSPSDPGLGHSSQTEVTQMQDSDSSDVELGWSQIENGSGVGENRGNSDHYEVETDQNKNEDEIANNHNGSGVEGGMMSGSRSFSAQFFPGSNSSPFGLMGSSSSWRPQEPRAGPRHGPSPMTGPMKRSYSWSERVFGSTNNQKCNSRFSP